MLASAVWSCSTCPYDFVIDQTKSHSRRLGKQFPVHDSMILLSGAGFVANAF